MLEGNFTFHSSEKSGGTLDVRFIISDGEIEFLSPVFNLQNITFSRIEAEMTLNNQKLKVKRCVINARSLDGNVSGLINIRQPFGQSYLRLLGIIKPKQEFLAELEKDLPTNLLPKEILTKKAVRIRIYGSFDEPRFFIE
jgi:hypothetical protein